MSLKVAIVIGAVIIALGISYAGNRYYEATRLEAWSQADPEGYSKAMSALDQYERELRRYEFNKKLQGLEGPRRMISETIDGN